VRLRAPVFRASGDPRRLGFAVMALEVVTADGRRRWSAPDATPPDGFHDAEPGGWRWTTGDAALPDALFAGLRGPALLVVRGFGPRGAVPTESHGLAFLAGDSYPGDAHVQTHLLRKLHPFPGAALVRHADMLAPEDRGRTPINLGLRQARLTDAVRGWRGATVLIGRSSGARVATLFAARHRAAAVVCLGYPFQAPGRGPEPERFAHLARIETPTLIVQGRDDPYGGAALLASVPLSPAVSVLLVEGGHEFHLDEEGWDGVARRVMLFVGKEEKVKEDVFF
jgi:hypothetical protein